VGQKKNAPADQLPERFEIRLCVQFALANFSAQEFAVAFETDFAAAQKVGHRRNGFLGVLGARANGENEIAE
jgi:hypothetical protein